MSDQAGGSVEVALWDLQRRMACVEARLGLAESRHAPVVREAPSPEPVARAAPVMPPPLPDQAVAPVARPRPVLPAYTPPPSPAAPASEGDFEQTIGLKWAGWVGAVVVVIGAALGIKYAFDQAWFEILPPAGRLLMMSLGAFALMGAGEYVFRKVHRFAAACLFGAGVATLFLVSYSGHGYYQLYESQVAFVLMALTTVIGAAVAVRGNLLSIAVLAQIGGNLAPLLIRGDRPLLGSFLAYLLALQILALFLAWWGASAGWRSLRAVSLVTTSVWVASMIFGPRFEGDTTLLVFSLLYAALYQAELLLSAARARVAKFDESAAALSTDLSLISPTGLAVPFSFAVTALLTGAVLAILNEASDATRGAWVVGLAAVSATLGVLSSRDQHARDPVYQLAIGYRIQAAALVVLAVPVALSGVWVLLGWAVLALAFATAGNLLSLRIASWAGAVVWMLAVGHLAWWTVTPLAHLLHGEAPVGGAYSVWLTLLGQDVRAYVVLAWLLAAAGHAVAWLVHPQCLRCNVDAIPGLQRLAWVTSALAGFVWVAGSIAGLPPVGATLAMLVYAWLLLGVDLLNPRLGLVLQSAAVVTFATVKWVAVDTLLERLAPGWSPTQRRAVFNALMGVGVLCSLTLAALYRLRRDALWNLVGQRHSRSDGALNVSVAAPFLALAAALVAIFAIGLTFEIDRVIERVGQAATAWPLWQLKHMSWTVLWTLCLSGLVALARRLEPNDALRPAWVRTAQVLSALVAVKFLLVDTLLFRAFEGPALSTPVANFQSFTALMVMAGLFVATRRMAGGGAAIAGFFAVLVVLWGGTLEIDRAFERMIAAGSAAFSDPRRAKQVAFSIFWSIFAVSAVLAGFRFRTAGLRYFGLGLFAVTLLKLVLIDMSQVQTGYRVLSFLGLGLLLMGTSVVYGKLSPMLRPRGGTSGAGFGSAGAIATDAQAPV